MQILVTCTSSPACQESYTCNSVSASPACHEKIMENRTRYSASATGRKAWLEDVFMTTRETRVTSVLGIHPSCIANALSIPLCLFRVYCIRSSHSLPLLCSYLAFLYCVLGLCREAWGNFVVFGVRGSVFAGSLALGVETAWSSWMNIYLGCSCDCS